MNRHLLGYRPCSMLLCCASIWCAIAVGAVAGCDDTAGSATALDALDALDAFDDSAGVSTCETGCSDDRACTRDACAADGVTCLHTFDEALCCTDDQCEIDGACYGNGEVNPDSACQLCRRVEDAEGWSSDDTASCDDGNACTTGDRCFDGACVAEAVPCDDGDPCTDDACDADSGACIATARADGDACDDASLCTDNDVCVGGLCVGAVVVCDDANTCTVDACDPGVGCLNTPDDSLSCALVDDLCSDTTACFNGVCIPTDKDCDDADLCTADYCTDGDGSCGHRELTALCADTNPCTDEGCAADQGCIYDFNTVACDDSNLCTAVDTCSQGVCAGTSVDIDDVNPCTDDFCEPTIGPYHQDNTLACDDNNACTLGDTCSSAACVPGATPLDCDDSDVCTDDSCDPGTGCVNTDNSARCDDGNSCTADACDAVTGCRNVVIQSFACRPAITVTWPPRASTLQGSLPASVTVTGTVVSDAGPISSFTINGDAVAVDPTTGAFAYVHTTTIGANTLAFLATDSLGTEVERVQAYHWSTAYTRTDAAAPGQGAVDPGLGIWLGQQTIDDGQAPPPTDLAEIFNGVLAGFDLSSFFDPTTPIASQAGFDIYLTQLRLTDTSVSLAAIDGGLAISASLIGINGDLFFDCPCGFPCGCWWAGGDSTGGLTIDSIDVDAVLTISVRPDHTLQVTVTSSTTTINALNIWSDNVWTNILLSVAEAFIRDSLVADLEADLNNQLSNVIGPLLEAGLSALAFNLSFDLPRLDGAVDAGGNPIVIPVALASDFSYPNGAAFADATPGPQGGALSLRAWATTPAPGVGGAPPVITLDLPTTTGDWAITPNNPFSANLGVPMRVDCGSGGPQTMVIPGVAPIEIVFPDDTLNQILRAAWWGGLLEFPVDPSLLGGVDLSAYGVTNLNLLVSGWLPPVSSDCGPNNDLRLYVGDLRIDATLELFGQPLDAVIYTAFEAPIALEAVGGDLAITVQDIENVQLEVAVTQESMLGVESTLTTLLETELVPALGGLLGGGTPIASFPLPEVDLSASIGQPAGTSLIRIIPLTVPPAPTRQEGNTIVFGQLQ